MKKFDVEVALAGAPVKLKNGWKAYVAARVEARDLLVGFIAHESNKEEDRQIWDFNGIHKTEFLRDFNIVGMWEEPREEVKLTLPSPVKYLDEFDAVYVLNAGKVERVEVEDGEYLPASKWGFLDCGLAFASREDAENAMFALRAARR